MAKKDEVQAALLEMMALLDAAAKSDDPARTTALILSPFFAGMAAGEAPGIAFAELSEMLAKVGMGKS